MLHWDNEGAFLAGTCTLLVREQQHVPQRQYPKTSAFQLAAIAVCRVSHILLGLDR